MRTRSIPAVVAVTALTLTAMTACGGGGGDALSEDDFVDAMADLCDDASSDLDRLEFPQDEDLGDFASDAKAIYEDALERLGEITPPEGAADDFDDFVGVLEDQVRAIDDLADANGTDEIEATLAKIAKFSDEQSEVAQDLDIAECDPNDGDDEGSGTTDSTIAEATPATSAAPTTPPTTAAPITLPTTVPPVATTPTTPATPAPTAPPSATGYEIVDLTEIFVAPDGFFLEPGTPDQATIDVIASLPELNEKLLSLGVATLVASSSGEEIADIWIGISVTDAMPADWKTLDCPTGELRTSANGILGIVCQGAPDSPTWEIFTATDGDVGISVYTLVPDIAGDLVADAFLAAN